MAARILYCISQEECFKALRRSSSLCAIRVLGFLWGLRGVFSPHAMLRAIEHQTGDAQNQGSTPQLHLLERCFNGHRAPLEFLAESPLDTSAISPVPVTKHGSVACCTGLGTGVGHATASNRALCPTFITAQLFQPQSQTAATYAECHWPHMAPWASHAPEALAPVLFASHLPTPGRHVSKQSSLPL